MSFRFEGLEIWHLSLDLASQVCDCLKNFPKEETFGLSQQIRKAAFSINLNIAEGSGRRTKKEFCHFLDIAKGSIFELVAGFYIALNRGYASEQQQKLVYNSSVVLAKKMSAFQTSLKSNHKPLNPKGEQYAISNPPGSVP